MKCPICNNDTFDEEEYEWEICPECYWEYDIIQVNNPDYSGGANNHSLNDYKKIYWRLKNENNGFSCRHEADRNLMLRLDREEK